MAPSASRGALEAPFVAAAPTPARAGLYDRRVDPHATDYALLDFGAGRRLDRFGAVTVDRPAPGAAGVSTGVRRLIGRTRTAAIREPTAA